jgi:hypothetical protein
MTAFEHHAVAVDVDFASTNDQSRCRHAETGVDLLSAQNVVGIALRSRLSVCADREKREQDDRAFFRECRERSDRATRPLMVGLRAFLRFLSVFFHVSERSQHIFDLALSALVRRLAVAQREFAALISVVSLSCFHIIVPRVRPKGVKRDARQRRYGPDAVDRTTASG